MPKLGEKIVVGKKLITFTEEALEALNNLVQSSGCSQSQVVRDLLLGIDRGSPLAQPNSVHATNARNARKALRGQMTSAMEKRLRRRGVSSTERLPRRRETKAGKEAHYFPMEAHYFPICDIRFTRGQVVVSNLQPTSPGRIARERHPRTTNVPAAIAGRTSQVKAT